jgi:hypothetical protein
MRFILGIIIGCALTVAVAYVTDASSASEKMVNWEVVSKHVHALSALARDGWKRIAG